MLKQPTQKLRLPVRLSNEGLMREMEQAIESTSPDPSSPLKHPSLNIVLILYATASD
jgi:hypothetical protein